MKQHISHNGREEHWRALMTACDQRPAGQSITDWLRDNGICKQTFYRWQRRFRGQATENSVDDVVCLPGSAEKSELSFVEIPLCSPKAEPQKAPLYAPAAVIHTSHAVIELSAEISDPVLCRILREVLGHA